MCVVRERGGEGRWSEGMEGGSSGRMRRRAAEAEEVHRAGLPVIYPKTGREHRRLARKGLTTVRFS